MSTTVARKSSPRPSEPTMPSRRVVQRNDGANRESLEAIPVLIRLHEMGREGATERAEVPTRAEVVTALEPVELAEPVEPAETVSRSASRRRHRRFALRRERQPGAAAVSQPIDSLLRIWAASPTRIIAGVILAGIVLAAVLLMMRNGRSQPQLPAREPLASWPQPSPEVSNTPREPWQGIQRERLSGGTEVQQARAETREFPTAPPLTPSVGSETARSSPLEMDATRIPARPDRTSGLELQPAESWSSDLGCFPNQGDEGGAANMPASTVSPPASGSVAPRGHAPGASDSSASAGRYPNTGAGVIGDPRHDLTRTPVRTGMRIDGAEPGGRQQWNQPGSTGGGLQGTIDYPRDRERYERIGPGLH